MKFDAHPLKRQRGARTTLLAGLALVATVALAGCTPDSPAPSSPLSNSPSPSSAPETTKPGTSDADGPVSSEAAIEQATVVLFEFNDLQNQITREGVADPELVDGLTVGAARTGAYSLVEDSAGGDVITGGLTITVQNAYTTDPTMSDGTVIPFGTVQLTYCADTTTRTITSTDGIVRPPSALPKFIIDANVQYDRGSASWKVASTTGKAEAC